MLRASVESFSEARDELEKLFPLHWRELGLYRDRAKRTIRWEVYSEAESRGALLFVALRKAARLVGYFIGFLIPPTHYGRELVLTNDMFWTHPDVRGGTAGLRLFRAVEREARAQGVSWVNCEARAQTSAGRLLKALGYEPVSTVYSKWLGSAGQ